MRVGDSVGMSDGVIVYRVKNDMNVVRSIRSRLKFAFVIY